VTCLGLLENLLDFTPNALQSLRGRFVAILKPLLLPGFADALDFLIIRVGLLLRLEVNVWLAASYHLKQGLDGVVRGGLRFFEHRKNLKFKYTINYSHKNKMAEMTA
jgi:hypothetical protein